MRTCQICHTASSSATCPNCGEASWSVAPLVTPREARELTADPEPEKPKRGRRRRVSE